MGGRLDALLKDFRYAARALRKTPRFSTAAVLTLALGLGATTVVFSLVDHIVLRALPYRDVNRLVVVREVVDELRATVPSLGGNASHFLAWQRECDACAGVAALRKVPLTLTGDGDPQRLEAVRISANFFSLLGVRPAIGRAFTPEEDAPGRDRVIMLGDEFWRRQYGGDGSIVGRTIYLNETPYTVAGVLPADFSLPASDALGANVGLPRRIDVFKPLALSPRETITPGEFDYVVLARLRDGVDLSVARAQLDAIVAGILARGTNPMSIRTQVTPIQHQVVGGVRRPLLFLLAAVTGLLLIVAVNLANLALARNVGRRRETAVRVALGAGRGRLARVALIESLLLAVAGGLFGFMMAYWGLRALVATAPATLPRTDEVTLDARVFAVGLIVAVLVGFAVGVLPAMRSAAVDPGEALKAGGRTSTASRGATRRRAAFIVSQIALSTMLLIGTGLFLRSFLRMLDVDRGFETERLLAIDVTLPRVKYSSANVRTGFHDQAIARLAQLPGVRSAALTTAMPLEGEHQMDMLSLENDSRPWVERPLAGIRYVSPEYFAAMGTAVRRGRGLEASDRNSNVVVLSERAAAALWPGENAIGKRVSPGGNDPISEVVGIASDVRTSTLEKEGSLIAYVPYWRSGPADATILIRTTGDPSAIAGAARATLRGIDPTVPLARTRTMEQVVSTAVAARRFQVSLLMMFAVMALVTASIGIYGVIAQSLSSRSGEIGVRMALGARPADVHRLVLGEGMRPVAIGLGVGTLGALAIGHWVEGLLFGVRPADPVTLAAVGGILALVALIACVIPARRATSVGLVEMLRAE